MKYIKIEIKQNEIFEEVSLATAYTGAKTESDKAFYERVATINCDDTLLRRFWNQACGIVTARFKNFIRESEIKEDLLMLNLELSNAYDDAMTPSVKSDLFSAMAAIVTERWFRITCP